MEDGLRIRPTTQPARPTTPSLRHAGLTERLFMAFCGFRAAYKDDIDHINREINEAFLKAIWLVHRALHTSKFTIHKS